MQTSKPNHLPAFNQWRRGLTSFIIHTRDGHPAGLLWASTRYAALNRAVSLAGAGATAEHTTN